MKLNTRLIEARFAALEQRLTESERESESWRKKYFASQDDVHRITNNLIAREADIKKLQDVIVEQKQRVRWLEKQVFGKKSEPTRSAVKPVESEPVSTRKRGKQPGAPGFGRKIREELEVEELVHEPSVNDKTCMECGCPYDSIGEGECSEEISWEYRLVRKRHLRRRYAKACTCLRSPKFVIASAPKKLIPKGMFDSSFWENVLIEKFLLQRPLNKVRELLQSLGLTVSSGTLITGLRKLSPLFDPLYDEIVDHWKTASHWQMDETHWKVFEDIEGKRNHTWWMWVALSSDSCAFVLDPTRSAQVPLKLLEGVRYGFLTTDRYSSYQALPKTIKHTYCWSHLRRDFITLRDGNEDLAPIAQSWVERIGDIFHENNLRQSSAGHAFGEADLRLRGHIDWMETERDRLLEDESTPEALRKVLTSLRKFWDGLVVFVDCAAIPMDNNESERRLRDLVVGRKNYYGSGSIWSGELAVKLFSLFQTLDKNGIEPRAFLRDYLERCAQNGGKPPPDAKQLLPWNSKSTPVDVVR